MSQAVYIVIHKDFFQYSYSIRGVFWTKELAEEFLAASPGGEIEELAVQGRIIGEKP